MQEPYETIIEPAEAAMTVKGSRFLAYCRRADSETAALNELAEVRALNPAATHHVWAYALQEARRERQSDDGEPAGTAGMPVLEAIRRHGVRDVVVIVVRYFGGTLLGRGGLVHAYREAADAVLAAAGRRLRQPCRQLTARLDYSCWARCERQVLALPLFAPRVDYQEQVTVTAWVPLLSWDQVVLELRQWSNGQVQLQTGPEAWWP